MLRRLAEKKSQLLERLTERILGRHGWNVLPAREEMGEKDVWAGNHTS